MGKGKRFNEDRKINVKKVIAVLLVIIVIAMFAIFLKKFVEDSSNAAANKVSLKYFAAYQNGKWGVIDGEGNTIIDMTYDEMITIPNKEEDVFVVTYDVNYEDETYRSKAINSKNEVLFKNYDDVEVISNYDKQNNLFYYDTCLKVKKDGKYGLIDLSGKQLINCIYDEIKPVKYLKNSLITIKDGRSGLASSTGALIINNKYDEILPLTDKYEDGYVVKNNGKFGVVGTNKKVQVPVEYEEIVNVHSGDLFVVKSDGKLSVYNSADGNSIEIKATEVKSIDNNKLIIKSENKFGVINKDGENVIEAKYQYLTNAFSNLYIAKLDDKYGIIDEEGNTKLDFIYSKLTYRKDADFVYGEVDGNVNSDLIDRNLEVKVSGIIASINQEEGYIKIRTEDNYEYYNFKFEKKKSSELFPSNSIYLDKKDGKYGYINSEGVVVVNYIYDDATEINEFGFAAVKQDGKWGAIDKKGKVIVSPELELTQNPVVNFLGKWHLTEDINSEFYTK